MTTTPCTTVAAPCATVPPPAAAPCATVPPAPRSYYSVEKESVQGAEGKATLQIWLMPVLCVAAILSGVVAYSALRRRGGVNRAEQYREVLVEEAGLMESIE